MPLSMPRVGIVLEVYPSFFLGTESYQKRGGRAPILPPPPLSIPTFLDILGNKKALLNKSGTFFALITIVYGQIENSNLRTTVEKSLP